MPFSIQKLSWHLPLIQKFCNFGEVHDLTSWTFHSIGATSFEQYLRYFLGNALFMPIAICKATPSYKNHLAVPLCQVDKISYTTPYLQNQAHIIWVGALGIPMPLGQFLDTKLFDQLPYVQLSYRSTDIPYTSIITYCEFWGFFLRCAGPWSFHQTPCRPSVFRKPGLRQVFGEMTEVFLISEKSPKFIVG